MHAEFDLHVPADLDTALAVLAENGADGAIMPLAGGTNMIVDLRARTVAPSALVSIARVPGMRCIEIADGQVRMGGRTTLSDLLRHPGLGQVAPSLVESARLFAGQMVRNTATLAGNICSGSPAADLVPPLLALDAQVTLASRSGSRRLPLAEFFHGYKQMERRADELMTEVSFPCPSASATNIFYKLARRKGDAITVVGVAVAMRMEGDICHDVRIALGSVASMVTRASDAEAILEGQAATGECIEAAARAAMAAVSPIDDIRASAEYRSHGVHVLVRRLLTQARDRVALGSERS
jgi:CO/xanthine dehydrogenase FAD-binding subunit